MLKEFVKAIFEDGNKGCEEIIINLNDEHAKEILTHYKQKFRTSLSSYDETLRGGGDDFYTAYGNKFKNKLQYILIQYAESNLNKEFKKSSVIQCIFYYDIITRCICRNENSLYYGSSYLSQKQLKQFGIRPNMKNTFDKVLIDCGYLNKITIKGEGCMYFPLFIRNENASFMPTVDDETVRSYFFGDGKF